MNGLVLDDVVDRERYAQLRPAYRSSVIAYKRPRRVSVGENVTLLFEDRETIRFQVQEMLWVEGIRAPNKIQYELDTYNELIPGSGELSATLFVDITEGEAIRSTLDRLIGIDEHVSLVLGRGDAEQSIAARFDSKQMEEDRLSAVQYIKFRLEPGQQAQFRDPGIRAGLRIDHPNYVRDVEFDETTRAILIGDLEREPDCLLADADTDRPTSASEPLFETALIRARRPAHPLAPGHVIVEPNDPVTSLLDASAELNAELMAGVQRAASEIVRAHGRCRVQTEIGSDDGTLSWHLYAPMNR